MLAHFTNVVVRDGDGIQLYGFWDVPHQRSSAVLQLPYRLQPCSRSNDIATKAVQPDAIRPHLH